VVDQLSERVFDVVGDEHPITAARQLPPQGPTDSEIVVDDEDRGRHYDEEISPGARPTQPLRAAVRRVASSQAQNRPTPWMTKCGRGEGKSSRACCAPPISA